MLLKKRYFQSDMAEIDHEISGITREIKHLEKILRKERRFSGSGFRNEINKNKEAGKINQVGDDTHRLASYLSTGSFHTISQHKFSSDLVRRQRFIIAGGIIVLLVAGLILWHYLG
jgi:hypothetical protein